MVAETPGTPKTTETPSTVDKRRWDVTTDNVVRQASCMRRQQSGQLTNSDQRVQVTENQEVSIENPLRDVLCVVIGKSDSPVVYILRQF